MKFNNVEKEVIYLKAIVELIDNMVNREVLSLLGNNPHSEIRFNTMTHQKYFNIILVDFLSTSDNKVLGEQLPYLNALQRICESPHFDQNNSINNLSVSTQDFVKWLEKEVVVENIWFPSIEKETSLSIKRVEFIKICGNISKHNFSRLSGVVREIKEIFNRNKIDLKDEEAILIIEDFYEWLLLSPRSI